MTKEELDALRAAWDAATPGEWHGGHAASGLHDPVWCRTAQCRNIWAGEGTDVTAPCAGLSRQDAELIALAKNALPRLLARVAELEGENAFVRRIVTDLQGEGTAYRRGWEDGVAEQAARQDQALKELAMMDCGALSRRELLRRRGCSPPTAEQVTTITQALEQCREWKMTDEEVEDLLR